MAIFIKCYCYNSIFCYNYLYSGNYIDFLPIFAVIAVNLMYITGMRAILNEAALAELIKQNRKRAGLSQIELAELAGVGKTLIFNIEKGISHVQLNNLLKVLRALNIKLHAEAPK